MGNLVRSGVLVGEAGQGGRWKERKGRERRKVGRMKCKSRAGGVEGKVGVGA